MSCQMQVGDEYSSRGFTLVYGYQIFAQEPRLVRKYDVELLLHPAWEGVEILHNVQYDLSNLLALYSHGRDWISTSFKGNITEQ